MRPIPLPVRVAAGLVAIALERARKVPEQLADLPVTAASRAVQAGMRVQQEVTKLAIKGDEVFAMLQPVHDTTPWARFDEDDELPAHQPPAQQKSPAQRPNQPKPDFGPDTIDRSEVGEVDEAYVAQKMTPHHPVGADAAQSAAAPPGTVRTTRPEVVSDTRPEATNGVPAAATDEPPAEASESEPTALPGYNEMSLAQLRGRLRALSLPELEALLEYEHAHRDRAPFVTMLSNRISTVRSQ